MSHESSGSPWLVRRAAPGSDDDVPGVDPSNDSTSTPHGVAVVPGSVGATEALVPVAPEADAWAWWWERRVPVMHPAELRWDRVATNATFFVDGVPAALSTNAFSRGSAPVPPAPAGATDRVLSVRIGPLHEVSAHGIPRPRWRSSLIGDRSLRFRRTPLLGRIPAWNGAAPAVGILGFCELVPASTPDSLRLSTRWDGTCGFIDISWDRPACLTASLDDAPAQIEQVDSKRLVVRIPTAQLWWPHTHGIAQTYRLVLTDRATSRTLLDRRVGFASVEARQEAGRFGLQVNGTAVFVRGVCWVPTDPVGWTEDPARIGADMDTLVAAGINLVRVCGTDTYPGSAFHDAAAERGLMVWEDVMLASLDPPSEPAWLATVRDELTDRYAELQGRPHVAVLCGGTETLQQPTLMGLLPADFVMPVLEEVFPDVARAMLPGVPIVTSSPSGGPTPISLRHGVAHYFGVGAYRRDLMDPLVAQVSFASEALAFSTPPERSALSIDFGSAAPIDDPRWNQGVPADRGADWTFADVTDHYVEHFFDRLPADAHELLDLRRAAVAHATATTFSIWRSESTVTAGGIVLAHRDLTDGPGWGWLDRHGRPKAPALCAADVLRPRTLLAVDRGLDGLEITIADDTGGPLTGILTLEAFARGDRPAVEAHIDLTGRIDRRISVDAALGWRDLTWHWRFGDPQYRMLHAVWTDSAGASVADISWPLGPLARLVPDASTIEPDDPQWGTAAHTVVDERLEVLVTASQCALFVHLDSPGWEAINGWFHLAPGQRRTIKARRAVRVRPSVAPASPEPVRIRAPGLPAIVSHGADKKTRT